MNIGFLRLNKISAFLLLTASIVLILVVHSLFQIISDVHIANFWLKILTVSVSGFLSFQGLFTLFWMLYAWEDPEKMLLDSVPETHDVPKTTFSLLVPARFEKDVIHQTIVAISKLNYPVALFEAIILCKSDDTETINATNESISSINRPNIKIVVFDSEITSKPVALNIGAGMATGEIIGVFDAEDQPKSNLLKAVDSIYQKEKPSVIQGGVQLMNFNTRWFSALNILEYYFWFKSALHLFSRIGVIPLGGNTIFFNRQELIKLGGWKNCLTEDAEIGIRFSVNDKKIRVFYDPSLVTEEESPYHLLGFLKQRSRWNQGFLQIFFSGTWLSYKGIQKKAFALYFLMLPQLSALNLIFIFLSFFTLFIKLPVTATLLVIFPLYVLILQLLTQLLGLREFSNDFAIKMPFTRYLIVILSFIPYQFLLAYSAVRACSRQLFGVKVWEKTIHLNLHRSIQ